MHKSIPNKLTVGRLVLGAGLFVLLGLYELPPARAAWMLNVGLVIFVLAGVTSGYRFRGAVDREVAGKLMHFSRSVFLARSLEIGMERADRFAIGAAFGDLKLGLYNHARTLS